MSDTAPADDEISLSSDGVTLTKTFTPDDLPVPAIRFRLESTHDQPRTVRITEQIPTSFSMDSVGFHPDYDAENWTAYQDNRVVYERVLEPGDTVETVYGIRIDDPDEATPFMTPPDLTVSAEEPNGDIAPPDIDEPDLEDIAPPEETEALKEVIAETGEDGPGLGLADAPLDDQAGREPMADAEPDTASESNITPAGEPTAESSSTMETAGPSTADDESTTQDESQPAESTHADTVSHEDASEPQPTATTTEASLVATLVEELESEDLDDERRQALQEALGVTAPDSVDARISHLQSRVEDVAAYSTAMETLLDDRGPDGEFLPDLHEDVNGIETDLTTLETRIDELTETVTTVETDLASVAQTVDETETTVGELQTRLTTLEETVDELDASLDVEAIETDIAETTAELETLRDQLETTQADIQEIQEWRQRLGEMFS